MNTDGFLLDPGIVFLNHGSFGACPIEVLEDYRRWQHDLERRPVEFLQRRLPDLLAEARAELARYVGARPDDLVFVPNTTSGVNVVARSLALVPGDEVLTTDEEYGACELAWQHCGATLVRRPVHGLWAGLSDATRVLFVSHITSPTARILPVADWIGRAHEAGLLVVVDGAHAPGQLPLDVESLGADVYIGNCHKWLCAPKGSGFLWVAPQLQERISSLVVSWGHRDGGTFLSRNEWQGTRDPCAYLTTPAAIRWIERNGEPARCHSLARDCANRVAELTGVAAFEPFAQMVAFRVPRCDAAALHARMLERHAIELVAAQSQSDVLVRTSFQVYNDESDVDRVVEALAVELNAMPSRAR